MNKGKFEKRLVGIGKAAVNVISNRSFSGEEAGSKLAYWPLILHEDRNEISAPFSEIDSCATSMAVSILLSRFATQSEPNELTISALNSLVFMRQENGAWPSVYDLQLDERPSMEGVVNDTVMALMALIQAGLLTRSNWELADRSALLRPLASFEARLSWLEKSVRWLEENRVQTGWYYTGTGPTQENSEIVAKIQPTTAVLELISIILGGLDENDSGTLRPRLRRLSSDAFSFLEQAQNSDGGFGAFANDESHLAHTCLVISALASDPNFVGRVVFKDSGIWLLKNGHSQMKAMGKGYLRASFVDRYSQVFFDQSGKYRTKKDIAHETVVHAAYLLALCDLAKNVGSLDWGLLRRAKLSRLMARQMKILLKRQLQEGGLKGMFHSLMWPAGQFPIYATTRAVAAIQSYLTLSETGQITRYAITRALGGFLILAGALAAGFGYTEGWNLNRVAGFVIAGVFGVVLARFDATLVRSS